MEVPPSPPSPPSPPVAPEPPVFDHLDFEPPSPPNHPEEFQAFGQNRSTTVTTKTSPSGETIIVIEDGIKEPMEIIVQSEDGVISIDGHNIETGDTAIIINPYSETNSFNFDNSMNGFSFNGFENMPEFEGDIEEIQDWVRSFKETQQDWHEDNAEKIKEFQENNEILMSEYKEKMQEYQSQLRENLDNQARERIKLQGEVERAQKLSLIHI